MLPYCISPTNAGDPPEVTEGNLSEVREGEQARAGEAHEFREGDPTLGYRRKSRLRLGKGDP